MYDKRLIVGGIVFALVIVGMFIFAYLKKSELSTPEPEPQPVPEEVAGPYDHITRVDAKHFFIDGTHTIVGEMLMPTPCDLLNFEAFVAESFPEQVTIDFSVINNAEACIQTVTPQRFRVSFDASEEASIGARLEGRNIDLNLIPAAEGETPDNFELFIKG